MNLYRHYGDFLNTIPDGALVVTEQGFIELVNTAAERMFGYSAGELNQQSYQHVNWLGTQWPTRNSQLS